MNVRLVIQRRVYVLYNCVCPSKRVAMRAPDSFELQQCYFIQILYIRILSLYVGGNAICGEEVRGCLRISLPATSHLAGKTGDHLLGYSPRFQDLLP